MENSILINFGLIVILPTEQSVKSDNIISKAANEKFGLPQGSTLGPLLSNINVNDISDFITDCTVIQYGDDTQIIHQSHLQNFHVIIKLTETTLEKIYIYFLHNGLIIC